MLADIYGALISPGRDGINFKAVRIKVVTPWLFGFICNEAVGFNGGDTFGDDGSVSSKSFILGGDTFGWAGSGLGNRGGLVGEGVAEGGCRRASLSRFRGLASQLGVGWWVGGQGCGACVGGCPGGGVGSFL